MPRDPPVMSAVFPWMENRDSTWIDSLGSIVLRALLLFPHFTFLRGWFELLLQLFHAPAQFGDFSDIFGFGSGGWRGWRRIGSPWECRRGATQERITPPQIQDCFERIRGGLLDFLEADLERFA